MPGMLNSIMPIMQPEVRAEMHLAKTHMGALIGRGGSTIGHIRQMSAATIKARNRDPGTGHLSFLLHKESSCIHTYIRTYIRTYTHTYIHTDVHTYIHTYVHTDIRTYIRTYMWTYICTCIHTSCIHTLKHTYMLNVPRYVLIRHAYNDTFWVSSVSETAVQ